MKSYSVDLIAGVPHEVSGGPYRFFLLAETEAAIDVEVIAAEDREGEIAEDVEGGFFVEASMGDELFNKLVLTSAVNQSVKFFASRRAGGMLRTTGTVNSVDYNAGRAVALREEAFGIEESQAAPGSGYRAWQIKNPSSTKNLIVKGLFAYASTGALAFKYGNYTGTTLGTNISTDIFNKTCGATTASVAAVYVGTVASAAPAGLEAFGRMSADAANAPDRFDGRDKEIAIKPGASLLIMALTATTAATFAAEWEEENA